LVYIISKEKKIRVLQDHTALKNRLKEYGFSQAEYFSFITSEDVSLNGYMIKPPNFDPSKKYPLFMFAYGGPESNRTENQYNGFYRPWFEMLAHRGYVVVCVDNRGTDCRGEEFRKSTYMELGKLETIDQLEVAKYMGSQPYIDESRIGMFGWSYGGFLSLSCLFKGDGLLKMAIAVAPVTNWRFYDTVYTERFMRKPQDNPDGYDENSPINFTKDMKGKLLLVHGMGDDNVHFQNSAELMKSLVDADKQFESQFYPNKNHGIYGGNTTYHLFSRMTNFINDNL
jgi:dipeptidyl-peptidase-4